MACEAQIEQIFNEHYVSYIVKEGLRFGSVSISVRLLNYPPSFVNAISLKYFVQFH